jgi:hypothetical protein
MTEPLNEALEKVKPKLAAVLNSGNGEVRILVRNKAVYRILKTEDELVSKK